MKKLFFTALVAVVAIGGAFAGNAQSNLIVTNAGPISSPNTQCTIQVPCSPTGSDPCTINSITYGRPNAATGKCTTPLFRD